MMPRRENERCEEELKKWKAYAKVRWEDFARVVLTLFRLQDLEKKIEAYEFQLFLASLILPTRHHQLLLFHPCNRLTTAC
jgi:tRNA(Ser,Leu) C12 N-acetylase TAN1